MLSAMIWKEWREQRTVMLAGLGIAVTLPFFLMAGASTMARGMDLQDLAGILPVFYAWIIWPLFAAASAAGTIANEKGEGSLGFLLSRPASRSGIWAVKMAVAAAVAALVAAGTLVVSYLFARFAAPEILDRLFVPVPWDTSEGLTSGILPTGVSILFFGAAAFFSTLLSRSLAVTGASIATSMVLLTGMSLVWVRVDAVPRLEPQFMAAETILAGLLFLAASWWTFTRAEMLRGGLLLRTGGGMALLSLGILLAATIPILQVSARVDPDDARFTSTRTLPDGSAVVAHVQDSRSGAEQVWWIPTDGAGMRRLTGRLTLAPETSPDGNWVAYLSLRGPLGLLGNRVSLRAVRTDGSADREILADMGSEAPPPHLALNTRVAFSPDGRQVAVKEESRLILVDLANGDHRAHLLSGPDLAPPSMLIGWAEGGIVLWQWQNPALGVRLVTIDPETGEPRIVFESEFTALWPWSMAPRPLLGDQVALVTTALGGDDRRSLYKAQLIDIGSGEITEIFEGPCASRIDFSPEVLAYSTCDKVLGETVIHLRDRQTGEEVVLGSVPWNLNRMLLSPRGDQVLIQTVTGEDPEDPTWARTGVFRRDASFQEFDGHLRPVGWSGRDRVVLTDTRDNGSGGARLLLGHSDGSGMRAIFP